jgi:SAM-dependent methyltransferase
MKDAYDEDLAYIHDAGFGRFARGAAALLLEDLRQRGINRGLVIDLGCGSGILGEQLVAGGFDVLGIDISPALLALARQRVPGGQFRVGSLLTAELPPCVAVAVVGECFNYLFDSGHSVAGVRQALGRIFEALAPGGLLLFDVAEPGRVPGPGPSRTSMEGDDWAVLVTAEEDRPQEVLTRHITSFRKVGELYRRDHEVHRLRLLPRATVVAWLEAIGFQVQTLAGYGEVPFFPGHVGFLARKDARAEPEGPGASASPEVEPCRTAGGV